MNGNLPHWASTSDFGASRGYDVYGGIDEAGNPYYFGDEQMARRNNARWADAARYHNQAYRIFNPPMRTSPFKVTSPFLPYADSWMRNPAIGGRIEGFDPDQSYGYVDPRRMDALRQRSGGRFSGQ
jgi:hypothetical protein